MAAERYFAAAGVSKSMLDILAYGTPAHLKAYLESEAEKEETPAMRFGSIVHRALLEPETFADSFYVKPEELKYSTKDGKLWKEEHGDRPVLDSTDYADLCGMLESVKSHPFAKRLIFGGVGEQAIFVVDSTGTLRKSRLDLVTKGNVLPDVKICDAIVTVEEFERRIHRYRYHVQAAYYLDNCRLLGLDKQTFMFLILERRPPYLVRCLQLMPEVIEYGRKLYQRDLQLYRNCIESNEWPGWGDAYEDVGLPSWEMKMAAEFA
jgi:exodeoxyribonuclease VIII